VVVFFKVLLQALPAFSGLVSLSIMMMMMMMMIMMMTTLEESVTHLQRKDETSVVSINQCSDI
jgi:hypothetical protein